MKEHEEIIFLQHYYCNTFSVSLLLKLTYFLILHVPNFSNSYSSFLKSSFPEKEPKEYEQLRKQRRKNIRRFVGTVAMSVKRIVLN